MRIMGERKSVNILSTVLLLIIHGIKQFVISIISCCIAISIIHVHGIGQVSIWQCFWSLYSPSKAPNEEIVSNNSCSSSIVIPIICSCSKKCFISLRIIRTNTVLLDWCCNSIMYIYIVCVCLCVLQDHSLTAATPPAATKMRITNKRTMRTMAYAGS